MYHLSDSRMGKYGFLEFIDRITVLDGDTGICLPCLGFT